LDYIKLGVLSKEYLARVLTQNSYGYILITIKRSFSNYLKDKIMPRLDGMGPMGQGPRSGRNGGNCQNAIGRFCRSCTMVNNGQVLTKEEQKKLLLEEREAIDQELADLKKGK